MKELKPYEVAAVKRQYQNSLPALKKIQAIDAKIAELQAERDTQMAMLEAGEAGIKRRTGGYMSTDLIKCEYVLLWNEDGSPKTDKEGRQLKKRVLTYVPPVEEEVKVITPPSTENKPGSDFDKDGESIVEAVTEDVEPIESNEDPFNF